MQSKDTHVSDPGRIARGSVPIRFGLILLAEQLDFGSGGNHAA
jgi:hypothetical protein